MKKIIPFKKDIIFDNLYEITSISLEHNLEKKNNKVEGEFTVSGSYRITETSTSTDDFSYNLPFEIEIDNKYDLEKLEIDIDDFYYEIIDNKVLSINIDVVLNKLEEILIPVEDRLEDESKIEDHFEELEERNEEMETNCIEQEEIKPTKEERGSIFNNLDNEQNYSTYKVYIVRENDTIEQILEKYKISKQEIEAYNDISLLKIGDKLIIPYVKN